jgi:RNA polymerase sigma-70 factor (ECF subfamily)
VRETNSASSGDPKGRTPETSRDTRLVSAAVIRAQGGDHDGLHFLYVRYAPDVRRYVQSFLQDQHEAEDVTQNVFAKLMTAIVKYEPRDVPFEAWLLRVARNAAVDCLRAKRATP